LINQLEQMVLVLAALAAVSVTATGVSPVASATLKESISGLTGTKEYWPEDIWPNFLGIFVTRQEIQRELRSTGQLATKVEIVCLCASRAGGASGGIGVRANPVFAD
jgi:hypothetical protein